MSIHSRRDFLKISGIAAVGALAPKTLAKFSADTNRPNIILLLLDTFSARHASLYGYPQPTTPNLEKFAESSSVYHRHYSGGNFTVPGTASMLTGTLPWTHGAVAGGGLVRAERAQKNMFSLLEGKYYRFAFAQNTWADRLIGQTPNAVERFLSPFAYSRMAKSPLLTNFEHDRALASTSFNDFLLGVDGSQKYPGSAVLGYLSKTQREYAVNAAENKTKSYPKGFPFAMNGLVYRNEEIYEGVYREISQLRQGGAPYFAYFHLFSPHGEYRPRADYRQWIDKSYAPPEKPAHPLSALEIELSAYSDVKSFFKNQRNLYDALIRQVDDELGKLMERLQADGVLENSYIILTSDHGELFERGFWGHGDVFMYEGATNIPLLIHAPGQTARRDIFSLTSNTDILPSLLSATGVAAESGLEGRILPEFPDASEDPNRAVFSIHARDNSVFAPLKKTAIAMWKREYKLIAYLGYSDEALYELYNLQEDPQEMSDLSRKDTKTLESMKAELLAALNQSNQSF